MDGCTRGADSQAVVGLTSDARAAVSALPAPQVGWHAPTLARRRRQRSLRATRVRRDGALDRLQQWCGVEHAYTRKGDANGLGFWARSTSGARGTAHNSRGAHYTTHMHLSNKCGHTSAPIPREGDGGRKIRRRGMGICLGVRRGAAQSAEAMHAP